MLSIGKNSRDIITYKYPPVISFTFDKHWARLKQFSNRKKIQYKIPCLMSRFIGFIRKVMIKSAGKIYYRIYYTYDLIVLTKVHVYSASSHSCSYQDWKRTFLRKLRATSWQNTLILSGENYMDLMHEDAMIRPNNWLKPPGDPFESS